MSALRFFFLGSLDIRYEGQRLPKPPTIKSQSLFAYLAMHRQQPQPRERLTDLFWSDRSERKARRSLTTALWHIRRFLPDSDDDLLPSDVHSVQFDPETDIWLDIDEFESLVASSELSCLQSAVALYQGPFMDGFYHDWVLNERYRLEILLSEALARLMTELENEGEYDGALSTGLQLLQHDRLREDAHRLVMRAFCRLGRRNAALEQYLQCQQIVKQELNVDPMEETSELYKAIMDGRFEVGPALEVPAAGKAVVEAVLPQGQNPLDPIVRGPLMGRESEIAFLQDRYDEAKAGHGSLVLVRGEAGVGKTRLVEELADHLRWQGGRVLWGRCYEFERIVPFQPVGEALQTVLSSISPSELKNIPTWILAELVQLVPELSEKLPELRASSEVPLDQEQTHLFESVSRFIASLSLACPLLLILEDIHWATESTLQMIHYLARHLAKQQVLIVGTLRPEEVGRQHALRSFQRQLNREGLTRSLNLANLSPQVIEALVVELSGRGEAVTQLACRLYEETEGNPLFLIEIIKALFETELVRLEDEAWRGDFTRISEAELPLPVGVSEAIQARVRRLEKDAQRTVCIAAVLGREFDFDLLNAACKQDEEETLEILDTLLRRRFIDEGSGPLSRDYTFHHHKIREVVYDGIPLRRRQNLHAQAGRAIETLYASILEKVAGELAFHFQEARQSDETLTPKAVQYLLLAGDYARLAYAHHEVIEYYKQALALQKEEGESEQAGRTLMKLGLAYHTQFDFTQAHQAFEEGFVKWQRTGRRDLPMAQASAPHALRIRWRAPHTLDPALSNTYVSGRVIDQMFSGLVSTTPDLDVVPEVAQRWEVLEGGIHYRFHLRSDSRWSDNTRLTAHDFEYAWKRLLNPATDGMASTLFAIKGAKAYHKGESAGENIAGVKVLDNWTLDVELEEPVSHFLYMLTHANACPVPQHVVETHGEAWTNAERIVSNGPFCLEEWDREDGMRLVRNPFYTGHYVGNVEQVELHIPQVSTTQDLSVPLEQYIQGNLDVLTLTDASVHDGDRIRRQFSADYVSAPWLFTIYLGFVVSRQPFGDVRLRQALTQGLDREELANMVLRGMYTPGTGGFCPPGMPGHSPKIGFPYNPERARELLAAASHTAGSGLPTLEGLSVPPIDPLVTQYLRSKWQENLGIKVEWDVADWPSFQKRLQQDPPNLYLLARFAILPDPSSFLTPWHEYRDTRWTSQTYEELIEKARQVMDQGTRLKFLRKADQILINEAAIVPLFYGRQHLLVKPWVSSFPISALNCGYWKDTIIKPH